MSFTPDEIYWNLKKYYPNFEIKYKPDFRQGITERWSESTDDSITRTDLDWKPKYDLRLMILDILENIQLGRAR